MVHDATMFTPNGVTITPRGKRNIWNILVFSKICLLPPLSLHVLFQPYLVMSVSFCPVIEHLSFS